MDVEELLKDVENFGHLGKDKGTMTASLELPQEGVKTLELATIVLEEALIWESNG